VAFERGKPGETNTNLDDSLDGKDAKSDPTEQLTTERVKELMGDLLQMRKRLKKEEESRKQFQELARKKDEEVKRARAEVQLMEKRV